MYRFYKLLDINMIYVIFIHLYNFSFNIPNIAVSTACRAFKKNNNNIYIYIGKTFIYIFVCLFTKRLVFVIFNIIMIIIELIKCKTVT